MSDIYAIARHWLAQDPDPETQAELSALIDHNNQSELEARFGGRLAFGTAGLRGPLQAGPMGMNRVLVAQAAAGLAAYLLATREKPSIVIGCDARKNSRRFAEDTAEIMQGAGVRAMLLPDKLPTPVLAFAVRELNTSAGVMVTASHNPPQDNGYKVYLGNDDGGSQIVPPADQQIADAIKQVAQTVNINDLIRDTNYQHLDDKVLKRYIALTAELRQAPLAPLNYVYTAMHGVGKDTLLATLQAAGLDTPHLVDAQCEPDPTFPTVDFPNPEEPGALDLAIALAKEHGAECIIANDPDADRLAVAFPDDQGHWQPLHGNDIGIALGWYLAQKAQEYGKSGTLACSMVSSPALGEIAKDCGLKYSETLTGFKWISRAPKLLFGYEEALGYLVDPEKVRDKDGISAAICFLDLLLSLKAKGQTFQDYQQAFVDRFGAYTSGQISIRVTDLGTIDRIMGTVRTQPMAAIAGFPVAQFIDHQQTEKASNILVFMLANGSRVIFRPSGTEPKLKIYLDCKADTVDEAKQSLSDIEADLRAYLQDV